MYGLNEIMLFIFFFFTSFKWQKDRVAEKDAVELGTGNHRRETVSLSCSLAVIPLITVREGVRRLFCQISSKTCFDDVEYKLPEHLELILREKKISGLVRKE